MTIPQYLQDAVDAGRALKAEIEGQTPEDAQAEQLAALNQFVSTFIKFRLPRAILALEAVGRTELTFDVPPDDGTGVQQLITDPIAAIEGLSVVVTPGAGVRPGYDLVTVTWPGAV